MDYRIYLDFNHWTHAHAWVGHLFSFVVLWGLVALAATAAALWLLDRPDGGRRWKIVAASSLASAALGLGINLAIHSAWHRDRPYVGHPSAAIFHPYSMAHDAGFPSDHATVAFGIAFGILFLEPLLALPFFFVALAVAFGRIIIGAHYPGDVGGSFLVALFSAFVVVVLARPVIAFLVRLFERVTDPLVAPLWRRAAPTGR